MEQTREEHLEWSKRRALEYVELGDLRQAFASMASDLSKHPETRDHSACKLGIMMLMAGQLTTKNEMRRFIEGFN